MIECIETPMGPLWLSGGPEAVERVSWTPLEGEPHGGALDWITRALKEYFLGKRETLPGHLLFMGPGVLWTRKHGATRPVTYTQAVLEVIAGIPYASVMTYSQVAALSGRPGAARAVGAICRANPLPVIIPCHRVVGKNSLGGYTPGPIIKERLLHIEGARVKESEEIRYQKPIHTQRDLSGSAD